MRSLIRSLLVAVAALSMSSVAYAGGFGVSIYGGYGHAGYYGGRGCIGVSPYRGFHHYRPHRYRQFSYFSPYSTIRNSLSYGVGASLYSPWYGYSRYRYYSRPYVSPRYFYSPGFYTYPRYDYCPLGVNTTSSSVLLGQTMPRGDVMQPVPQVAEMQSSPQVVAKPVSRGIKMQIIEHDWSSLHASRKDVASADALFRDKDYDRALLLYDEAIKRSPELSEAHFRRAMTLVAKGEVEAAAVSLRKGLGRTPNPMGYRFALRELYKTNEVDKQAHLDYVATKALKNQADGELFFVLGVMLHLDEQYNRAGKFLQFSAKLDNRTNGDYVRRLVKPVEHKVASNDI